MKQNDFPPGWDEERVRSVIAYYDQQTEDENSDRSNPRAPAERNVYHASSASLASKTYFGL
jgi:hypothetical protein